MSKVASTSLSLKDLNRMIRPSSLEDLIPILSWETCFEEIDALLADTAQALLLLCGDKGSGKSTFQRLLSQHLIAQSRCHVIRGVIAQPINQCGWLLDFLSEAVAGASDPLLSPRELVHRIHDLCLEHESVVILLDGLDLVQAPEAIADFQAFLELIQAANARVLIISTVDPWFVDQSNVLKRSHVPGFMVRPLPAISAAEQQKILQKRLELVGFEKSIVEKITEEAIVMGGKTVGELVSNAVEILSCQKTPPTKKIQATKNQSKQKIKGNTPKALNTKNDSEIEPLPFDDFLNPQLKR